MNLLFPRPQFVDSNGLPLASGTLETYAAGTTTPKATYPTKTDLQAATNANNTTLTLNSLGRPTVDLWLNGSYKFILKDLSSNTIYTVDNINDPEFIRDSSGNEVIQANGVASAVNYLKVSNSATGTNVVLAAVGDDTNVGITVTPKGSGGITLDGNVTYSGTFTLNSDLTVNEDLITVSGSASSSAAIRLGEDTDNGSNYMEIKAPSSITANATITLPDGVSTNGYYYNTAGVMSFIAGKLIKQIVISQDSTVATGSTQVPTDNTIPQNTEGDQYLSVTITPNNSNNILLIDSTIYIATATNAGTMAMSLYQDSTANASATSAHYFASVNQIYGMHLHYYQTAGSTSALTFKIRAGKGASGTNTFNGSSGSGLFGQKLASYIRVIEVEA